MARAHLLLVERDAKTRRLLKVSLEQVGYDVDVARDGLDAWNRLVETPYDLVLTATTVPKLDGYGLVQRLKGDEDLGGMPVVFLLDDDSIEAKIRGLELGVEAYLVKPIFVKELLSEVEVLLAKRVRHRLSSSVLETRVQGRLSDLPPIDLLESLEHGRQSGVVRMRTGDREATVVFQDGEIIDARLRRLRGEEVIYRLLTWVSGAYEVDLSDVDVAPTVEVSTRAIIEAGMRHAAEFRALSDQLPPLETVLQVDADAYARRADQIPEEIRAIVELVDGRRTLNDLLDESPFDDLSTLETVAKLYAQSLMSVVAQGVTSLDRSATPLVPEAEASDDDLADSLVTMRPPNVAPVAEIAPTTTPEASAEAGAGSPDAPVVVAGPPATPPATGAALAVDLDGVGRVAGRAATEAFRGASSSSSSSPPAGHDDTAPAIHDGVGGDGDETHAEEEEEPTSRYETPERPAYFTPPQPGRSLEDRDGEAAAAVREEPSSVPASSAGVGSMYAHYDDGDFDPASDAGASEEGGAEEAVDEDVTGWAQEFDRAAVAPSERPPRERLSGSPRPAADQVVSQAVRDDRSLFHEGAQGDDASRASASPSPSPVPASRDVTPEDHPGSRGDTTAAVASSARHDDDEDDGPPGKGVLVEDDVDGVGEVLSTEGAPPPPGALTSPVASSEHDDDADDDEDEDVERRSLSESGVTDGFFEQAPAGDDDELPASDGFGDLAEEGFDAEPGLTPAEQHRRENLRKGVMGVVALFAGLIVFALVRTQMADRTSASSSESMPSSTSAARLAADDAPTAASSPPVPEVPRAVPSSVASAVASSDGPSSDERDDVSANGDNEGVGGAAAVAEPDPMTKLRQLLGAGAMKQAVPYGRAAIAKSPDNADAYYLLGEALRGLGRADDARAIFDRCVERGAKGQYRRWCVNYSSPEVRARAAAAAP